MIAEGCSQQRLACCSIVSNWPAGFGMGRPCVQSNLGQLDISYISYVSQVSYISYVSQVSYIPQAAVWGNPCDQDQASRQLHPTVVLGTACFGCATSAAAPSLTRLVCYHRWPASRAWLQTAGQTCMYPPPLFFILAEFIEM